MCTQAECISRLTAAAPYIHTEFGVESMQLFGSMARGNNRSDSDVDIIVEMPPKMLLVSGLHDYLESLLKTSVDLVRRHSNMSVKFLSNISRDAIKIL